MRLDSRTPISWTIHGAATHILLTYGYLLLFAWCWWSNWAFRCRYAGAAGGWRALGRRPYQLHSCLRDRRGGCPHFRHGLVFRWPQPWASCSTPSVQTLARTHNLRPPHQDSFGRRRGVLLMFAKFVPAWDSGAACGRPERHGIWPFLFFDGIGASLWVEHCWPRAASSATCSSAIRTCSTGPAGSPALCSCSASWHSSSFASIAARGAQETGRRAS